MARNVRGVQRRVPDEAATCCVSRGESKSRSHSRTRRVLVARIQSAHSFEVSSAFDDTINIQNVKLVQGAYFEAYGTRAGPVSYAWQRVGSYVPLARKFDLGGQVAQVGSGLFSHFAAWSEISSGQQTISEKSFDVVISQFGETNCLAQRRPKIVSFARFFIDEAFGSGAAKS